MIKPQIWPCCLGTILISDMALKQQHTVLSTLADNRQNLPFLVDSTLWQWNFKYFALFELFYFILFFVFFLAFLLTLNIFSETMVRHWNISNNVTGGKLTNQVKCHNFRAFLEKWHHVLCISDVICQFSIFENLRGWQPWT